MDCIGKNNSVEKDGFGLVEIVRKDNSEHAGNSVNMDKANTEIKMSMAKELRQMGLTESGICRVLHMNEKDMKILMAEEE
jgi:hypothetical protein